MANRTKADLINGAYSKLRISGKTKSPDPEDIALALVTLENMAWEFYENNIDIGYFFEEEPDAGTPHNVHQKHWYAVEILLADRLSPDFGKSNALFSKKISGAYSFLCSSTATVRHIQYPRRQPVGSANELNYNRYQRYYNPEDQVPIESKSVTMHIDDIDDFTESFAAYLKEGETISSYTIESDDGLTVNSSSINSNGVEIDYNITADGTTGEQSDALLKLRIIVTTSDSRILTRIINFQLIYTDVG